MDNFGSLRGKTALVTGAAAGIGAACAKELVAAGASVMLTDINVSACEQLSRSLNAAGATTFSSAQDVTSEDDWSRGGR